MELLPLTLAQLKESSLPRIYVVATPQTLRTLDRMGYKLYSVDSAFFVQTENVLCLDPVLKSITYPNVSYYVFMYDPLPLYTLVTTTLKPKELK